MYGEHLKETLGEETAKRVVSWRDVGNWDIRCIRSLSVHEVLDYDFLIIVGFFYNQGKLGNIQIAYDNDFKKPELRLVIKYSLDELDVRVLQRGRKVKAIKSLGGGLVYEILLLLKNKKVIEKCMADFLKVLHGILLIAVGNGRVVKRIGKLDRQNVRSMQQLFGIRHIARD